MTEKYRENKKEKETPQAKLYTSAINVAYVTGFTGDSSELLEIDGKCYFFTDSRYTEQAKKDISGDIDIITTTAAERLPSIACYLDEAPIHSLGIEKSNLTIDDFENMQDAFPAIDYIDISLEMLKNRAIKTNSELAKIKKAARANELVLNALLDVIKPGISELDIRAELLYQTHRLGMNAAFEPIIASGENSALPHATVSNRKLNKGDLLTIDFGCKFEGYCSDMTRTFGIGNIDETQKKIYDIVKLAQQSALEKSRIDSSASEIDRTARDIIAKYGYEDYYQHGTGHGVGLQIHELPVINSQSNDSIEKNMVYTIEPGIYVPGVGGVRIEDMCIAGTGNLYAFTKDLILL